MKEKMKITLAIGMALTMLMGSVTAFADELNYEEVGCDYSVQEIVDEINEKYDINLELVETPQAKAKLAELTEEEFVSRLEEKAAEIAKHREESIAKFEERTGRKPSFNRETKANKSYEIMRANPVSYSCTKTVEHVPVTVKGKTIVDTYKRFYSISSVTGKSVTSIINTTYSVEGTDYDLIDNQRTCAVSVDVIVYYYDAELGYRASYDDVYYGEFYATEG